MKKTCYMCENLVDKEEWVNGCESCGFGEGWLFECNKGVWGQDTDGVFEKHSDHLEKAGKTDGNLLKKAENCPLFTIVKEYKFKI